ncbi:MAG: Crp/Fnr family transcriptional regulator [Clostridium sp.]|nr:Crp/Fnr family transcriptional regulator [Prevotella sp.]MCM1428707.1 Crp/Fnr family transcriptional regulator [Clostridium sp.]MCM1475082.1 Crp/Fnr family transcriptional regulator [Muribaculaceae bacterium]
MIKESTLEHIISHDMAELWSVLTAEEKRLVSDNFDIQRYRKNQIIYAEGDEPEYLWCLLKGKVKMYKSGIGERIQILRLYRPVQFFGYRAYFAKETYVSSAQAFEASTIGLLPMAIVERLIKTNNDVAMFFIHELSRNLGGSDTKIVNLTQKHIRGRLAESLLLLADNYGLEDDDATLKIYMSREDLANLSNMTTSNAIRTLTTFVTEKLIIVDGRRIKIINEPQLRKISKYG